MVVEGEALPPYTGRAPILPSAPCPPMLEGRSFDGSSVMIDPSDGTPKLVVFLAHHCPHCQAEVPRIVDWAARGSCRPASTSTAWRRARPAAGENYPPSAWLEREGWPFPTLADSDDYAAAEAWGLRPTPTSWPSTATGRSWPAPPAS